MRQRKLIRLRGKTIKQHVRDMLADLPARNKARAERRARLQLGAAPRTVAEQGRMDW